MRLPNDIHLERWCSSPGKRHRWSDSRVLQVQAPYKQRCRRTWVRQKKVGNATIQRPDGNMNKSDDTVKEMSEWGGSGTTKLCHTGARSDETFQRSSTITHQPSIEGQHCPTSPKALQAVAIWQLDMIAVLVRCSIRDQLIYESCQVLLCLLPCLG